MGKKWLLTYGIAGVIALTAVGSALAASGKKTHKNATNAAASEGGSSKAASGPPGGPGGGPGGPGGPGGAPSIHSESVVPNKEGTAFITVTMDSGTVKSVEASAGKLTIEEGTKTLAYKTVTLTIPKEATVILDGKTSSLSSLAAGDHVTVCSSAEGTTVQAADPSFQPEAPSGGHGGPPPGGPGGALGTTTE